ncbi:hypothetical protein GQ53DRAFT_319420 [Thozetella sp. PMI_491]|nr:hypothetical protein GQ53DRAFT_319420 [Thozetella sp. PMI_491]
MHIGHNMHLMRWQLPSKAMTRQPMCSAACPLAQSASDRDVKTVLVRPPGNSIIGFSTPTSSLVLFLDARGKLCHPSNPREPWPEVTHSLRVNWCELAVTGCHSVTPDHLEHRATSSDNSSTAWEAGKHTDRQQYQQKQKAGEGGRERPIDKINTFGVYCGFRPGSLRSWV